MLIQRPSLITPLFIAINEYAHNNGSHKGIIPNKVFLLNTSTFVDINILSKIIINIKPTMNIRYSFFSYLINSEIEIIIMYNRDKI